jgi:hypothetical protein
MPFRRGRLEHSGHHFSCTRAWLSLIRPAGLHDKGMILDSVGKVKSLVFTQEGLVRAKQLFGT